MAPEQASGARALDARVDVYAVGAVLHEILAGEPPFAAPTRQAVVRRMMHDMPSALANRRPDVSPSVAAAVWRALAKRPDDRYASASAFSETLAAALTVPFIAPTPRFADAAVQTTAEDRRHRNQSRGRTITARSAFYVAAGTLFLGLAGGLLLDRSTTVGAWAANARNIVRAGTSNDVPLATSGDGRLASGDLSLAVVDRTGGKLQVIPATRPWTPRFSPDGKRVAYGAYGSGRETSDLWVTDLETRTTKRLTDDDADDNDPQWSSDGGTLAYSTIANGGKDVELRPLASGTGKVLARRNGTQFPSDWLRDGSALLVTDDAGADRHDVLVQPANGSPARPYVATRADETAARVSPDGRWVAYTSDESGRAEVYLDSYPAPRKRVAISSGGGVHAVWRADGRELYYWREDALVAAEVVSSNGASPYVRRETVLFRAPYQAGLNTMYDASPDGQRFVIVLHQP
jgi:hypothetical protein